MSAYRNYPEGRQPSGGIFYIEDGAIGVAVEAVGDLVSIDATVNALMLPPAEARELAAALIECADYIERNAMTAEDIAKETRNRA